MGEQGTRSMKTQRYMRLRSRRSMFLVVWDRASDVVAYVSLGTSPVKGIPMVDERKPEIISRQV